MRRTVLSAMALACTAALASTVPAFADDASHAAPQRPSAVPSRAQSARPSAVPTRAPSARPSRTAAPTRPPAQRPRPVSPRRGQVAVVPKGAPDTGVATESSPSGTGDELLAGGAAAALVAGGAAVFVVRRRRATGA